ncbi:MAG: hypothetical protein RLZZ422_1348 [Pseudomonadota bacterium]|jgi:uncharacterized protein (TIGR00369 family)
MLSTQQINTFLANEFPQCPATVEKIGNRSSTVRYKVDFSSLRPGGTVSGPVMMLLADVALYVAILGEIGLVPLAVTTNLNINFLLKPKADKDLIGVCTLLKLGKVLAVGEVSIYSEGDDEPVAHAVGTYSIPAKQ